MEKTMRFCKRFRPMQSELSAAQLTNAKEDLLKKVEVEADDGSVMKIRRCKDFEAVQLLNLMPRSAEEAAIIIPTLRDNEFLDDLISELEIVRQKERGFTP